MPSMTVIPLPTDDDWDTEDYSLVDSELLPVKIVQIGSFWYWRLTHPKAPTRIGPFMSAKDAYIDMMQWDKDDEPAEIPSLFEGRVAMGALDATAERLVMKMLESGDPAEQAKARELIEKYSYD